MFKYDRDWFVCKQAALVPVIFEPPCINVTPLLRRYAECGGRESMREALHYKLKGCGFDLLNPSDRTMVLASMSL
jgi:hypothetical protein